MNKKRYIKPALKVFELEHPGDIICSSNYESIQYNGTFFIDESQIG